MNEAEESGQRVDHFQWSAKPPPGSRVNTDDGDGYKGLGAYGYQHRPRVQGDSARAAKILPWVHRVIGNLKTWLRGTHHGRVETGYLQSYLEEFTFRYNRRRSREHSFLSLLVLATRISPPQPVLRRQVESTFHSSYGTLVIDPFQFPGPTLSQK